MIYDIVENVNTTIGICIINIDIVNNKKLLEH